MILVAKGTTDATGLTALLQGNFQQLQRSNSLVPSHYRTLEPSFYFQDDWHATSKLTLNLGVRYDVFIFRKDLFYGSQGSIHTPPQQVNIRPAGNPGARISP